MPDPARRVSAGAVALALAALLGTIAATAGPAPRASAQTGCSATIDLVVVLDGSESIAPDDFELMRSFAGVLISHFTLDPEYALAGLVQFSGEGEGRVESQLTDDGPTILGSVAAMPQIAGARDIQEGIAYGQGEIKIGGRPGARGALVMLTDGAHNQPGDPAGEAEAARAYGTEVFAVGVGPGPDMAELDAVAAGQAFSVGAFDELAGILERLVQAVCPDLPVGGVSQAPYPEPPDSPEASGPDGRESTVLGVAGLPETGSGLPEDWPDRAAKLAAQGLAGMGSALLLIGVTYYVARRREQR